MQETQIKCEDIDDDIEGSDEEPSFEIYFDCIKCELEQSFTHSGLFGRTGDVQDLSDICGIDGCECRKGKITKQIYNGKVVIF